LDGRQRGRKWRIFSQFGIIGARARGKRMQKLDRDNPLIYWIGVDSV
jgi:hypothetical protein